MTDFLDRIAGRALGQSPEIQPLIAPRFAAGPEILSPEAARELPAVSAIVSPGGHQRFREDTMAKQSAYAAHEATSAPQQPDASPQINTGVAIPAPSGTKPLAMEITAANVLDRTVNNQMVSHQITPVAQETSEFDEPLREPQTAVRKVIPVIQETHSAGPANVLRKEQTSSETARPPASGALESTQHQPSITAQQPSAVPGATSRLPRNIRPTSMQPIQPEGPRDQKRSTRDSDGPQSRTVWPEEELVLKDEKSAPFSRETQLPVPPVMPQSDFRTTPLARPKPLAATVEKDMRPPADPAPVIQTPPTIKVTIGRVEVRAVYTPPAAAREPAMPLPRMSLDDYLKSHKGGRR